LVRKRKRKGGENIDGNKVRDDNKISEPIMTNFIAKDECF